MPKAELKIKEIPLLDVHDLESDDADVRARLIQTIGDAFHDIGFIFVRTPEVTAILPEVYDQFRAFFYLPASVKAQYERPKIKRQRGWTPSFTEIAILCRKVGDDGEDKPDAKENFYIGPNIDPNHPLVRKYPEAYPPNVWSEEVPGLEPAMWRLYHPLFKRGRGVLRALEIYLGKPDGYFDEMVHDSPTVMRAMHYPPVTQEQVGNIVWACEHTDIDLISVLPASTKRGLRIRRRDGKWIPGNAPEGYSIVQVGDMLQDLTGGDFMSALHKVRAPDHETTVGRFSAAAFIQPCPHVKIKGNQTANELLEKRLRVTGMSEKDSTV